MMQGTREDKRSARRAELSREIPAYYHPGVFFGLTNAMVALAIFTASHLLSDVRPLEWLTVPAVFLFANFFEYCFHRGPMHVRWLAMDVVFQRHTNLHHAFFPHNEMGMRRPGEAYLVLFPIWAIFLVFALAAPVFFITWWLTNTNVAGLFLITALAYFLLYEWLHLIYHLPDTHPLNRLHLVRFLKRHHQIHHNPSLMTRYNFNITFPIWDRILGTTYSAKQQPSRQN